MLAVLSPTRKLLLLTSKFSGRLLDLLLALSFEYDSIFLVSTQPILRPPFKSKTKKVYIRLSLLY